MGGWVSGCRWAVATPPPTPPRACGSGPTLSVTLPLRSTRSLVYNAGTAPGSRVMWGDKMVCRSCAGACAGVAAMPSEQGVGAAGIPPLPSARAQLTHSHSARGGGYPLGARARCAAATARCVPQVLTHGHNVPTSIQQCASTSCLLKGKGRGRGGGWGAPERNTRTNEPAGGREQVIQKTYVV